MRRRCGAGGQWLTRQATLLLFLLSALGPTGSAVGAGAEDVEELLWNLQIAPVDGQPPPFTLDGLDGRSRSLAEARGQVVLLYFWASW
jgi:hypothetical protein